MKKLPFILIILAVLVGFVAPTLAATPIPIGGGLGDNFSGQPGIELLAGSP